MGKNVIYKAGDDLKLKVRIEHDGEVCDAGAVPSEIEVRTEWPEPVLRADGAEPRLRHGRVAERRDVGGREQRGVAERPAELEGDRLRGDRSRGGACDRFRPAGNVMVKAMAPPTTPTT